MTTTEYNSALEITKQQYLNNPIGYSNYEASSAADQQLIRQNNVIIYLLEEIIKKLNGQINGQSVDDLVKDLNKLNIGSSKKKSSKTKGQYTFAYYK